MTRTRTVAVLLYDRVNAIDVTGPLEAFATANGKSGRRVSVESLASRAGLSTRQFSRRFRAAFGTPPATYIKRLRLDAGRTLLGQGISIAQAAHATGFGSSDGFRRAFESRFGVSPGEYRKRFRHGESGR